MMSAVRLGTKVISGPCPESVNSDGSILKKDKEPRRGDTQWRVGSCSSSSICTYTCTSRIGHRVDVLSNQYAKRQMHFYLPLALSDYLGYVANN